MAIFLQGQPVDQTPAYNNIYWYFDSNNKTKLGFRYIVDVYRRTGTASQTLIKRLRIPPEIGTGRCVAEISKTLQSFVTNQKPSVVTGTQAGIATDSYIRYNLQIGEEYESPWVYSDYEFYAAPTAAADPWNAYTILTSAPVGGGGTQAIHNFQVGDSIVVDQADGGALKPMLQGLHTVVKVLTNKSIVIDIPFSLVGSGAAVQGNVTFANGQKTIFPNLLTINDKGAFNAALPHIDFRTYSVNQIQPNLTGTAELLTNLPDGFTVTQNTGLLLNVYRGNAMPNVAFAYYQNNFGATYRVSLAGSAKDYNFFGTGPANLPPLSLVSGTGPLLRPDLQYYDVWCADSTGLRVTEKKRLYYRETCSKYPIQSIMFLDRRGSLGGFDFSYSSRETARIERGENRFLIGGFTSGKFNYSSFEAEQQVVNVNLTESIELNTAWLSQVESDYFQELLSTPVAYMRLGTAQWWPVIVEETASERKDLTNNKNIRYTVRVKIANTNAINW